MSASRENLKLSIACVLIALISVFFFAPATARAELVSRETVPYLDTLPINDVKLLEVHIVPEAIPEVTTTLVRVNSEPRLIAPTRVRVPVFRRATIEWVGRIQDGIRVEEMDYWVENGEGGRYVEFVIETPGSFEVELRGASYARSTFMATTKVAWVQTIDVGYTQFFVTMPNTTYLERILPDPVDKPEVLEDNKRVYEVKTPSIQTGQGFVVSISYHKNELIARLLYSGFLIPTLIVLAVVVVVGIAAAIYIPWARERREDRERKKWKEDHYR